MSTTQTKDTTVSEEIKSEPQNIYEALMLAQSEMEAPTRTELAKGEKFSYTYAPLDVVIKVTKPLLRKYGLVIMQTPINDLDLVGVKTTLAFKDGTTIDSQLLGRPVKPDPQGIGSLITYYRRYAWMAVCGIAPEDDDAQSAMPEKKSFPSKREPVDEATDWKGYKPSNTKPASDKQIKLLRSLLSKAGKTEAEFKEVNNIEHLSDLTSAQISGVINKLMGKSSAKEGAMYDESIQ